MGEPHDHRVLVPVDVLGGQSVPETIVETFASIPVVVLGYHEIPDQTVPDQARAEHEQQAQAELEELRTMFETAGCEVTTRLVFTHDRFKTFERVALELDCDAVLIPNPAPILERILVAIRGDTNVDYIARLVATVLAGTEIDVTLFHVASSDESRERGRELLETAASTLVEQGVERDRIDIEIVAGAPTDAIFEAASDHDLIVAGESRPSIRRLIFRDRAERIAKRTVDPVLVIRGAYLESNAAKANDEPTESS
ncbi:universal stress protein [Halobacteria archaeon AArc-m2/3/4]|uniref:Universal stress protein n=1 Tax=Natronoglomus mannanivorans TaxID=2979990 RepID=A0AAP3E1M9_9EURY|nr:universal stress protein [Halobacteria archaeon AArc-xg1-1]MCU4973943.1 universal stress protein [Halobacteria archaeon AArc-m2/3/4]